MELFKDFGPWALFAAALLYVFKDLLLKAMDRSKEAAERKPDSGQTQLAAALDKLADVLGRIERSQEKALDEVQNLLRGLEKTVQGIDYRTREIRERLPIAAHDAKGD